MKVTAKHLGPPVAEDVLLALRSVLPATVPPDYFEFLRRYDGAEVCFSDVDWERDGFDSIRVFSAAEMLEMRKKDWLSEALPTMFVIGSDSGGQFLAYDMRGGAPWQVVMYLPGCSDDKAYTPIAASLAELAKKYEEQKEPNQTPEPTAPSGRGSP